MLSNVDVPRSETGSRASNSCTSSSRASVSCVSAEGPCHISCEAALEPVMVWALDAALGLGGGSEIFEPAIVRGWIRDKMIALEPQYFIALDKIRCFLVQP